MASPQEVQRFQELQNAVINAPNLQEQQLAQRRLSDATGVGNSTAQPDNSKPLPDMPDPDLSGNRTVPRSDKPIVHPLFRKVVGGYK